MNSKTNSSVCLNDMGSNTTKNIFGIDRNTVSAKFSPQRAKALVLYLGLLLFSCVTVAQQRAQHPNDAFLFVSPNTASGLSFQRAVRNLRSLDEITLIKAARVLLCRIEVTARITPAIGSWSDGVENSVLIHGPLDVDRIRYLSAMLGHRAHQKSVLYFRKQPNGPVTMYTMRLGRRRPSLEKTAKILEKSGIQFRTLIPSGNRTIVYIVDLKGGLKLRVDIAARRLNAKASSAMGSSEVIGDDTSAESAEQVYSPIIKQFESTHVFK